MLVTDQKDRVGRWVAERVYQTASWGDFYAMGAERDGELVAGIVCNNFNGVNATVHICIEKPGKDMIELFRAFCDYAFRQCGLKRITGMVDVADQKVIEFDKHIGFEEEFVMKYAGSDGGDLQVLVMYADKCKWL